MKIIANKIPLAALYTKTPKFRSQRYIPEHQNSARSVIYQNTKIPLAALYTKTPKFHSQRYIPKHQNTQPHRRESLKTRILEFTEEERGVIFILGSHFYISEFYHIFI
jgi:hypothetical protein